MTVSLAHSSTQSLAHSLARDVEQAVAHGDPETRRTMLRRMTDLFVDNAERLSEDQVSAFDTVILRLARSVETAARSTLANTVADIGNAPREVVRDLAFDADAGVAGPVLARSTQLAEGDLVHLAQERGQAHLYALSRRRSLSERVTDVLVTRGDGAVVRSVAGNQGARLSADGLGVLASRAASDAALHDLLALRRDVPAEHVAHLVATARARVARKLGDEFGGQAVDAVSQAAAHVAQSLAGPTLSLREAEAQVDAWLAGRGGRPGMQAPDEADLVAWLAEGRVMEALVGLARAAAMPPDMVLRAYQGAHSDPLLFLVRSVRLGWGTFKAFLLSKPGDDLPADEMRGLFDAFQALSVSTAQRVVRFTAAREQMQKAG